MNYKFLKKYLYIFVVFAIMKIMYSFAVRPFLIKNMKTVKIEIIYALILALGICCVLIVIAITAIIILVRFWLKYNNERIRKKLLSQIACFLLLLIFGVIEVSLSQIMSYTPPILDNNGKIMENSIAKLEKVELGKGKQWISIRGKNKDNPILLFLAGGPGGTQLAATRRQLSGLEDSFVVVNWEQPGSGKSYSAVSREKLTPRRYIEDGIMLVEYLKKEYNKEKIYIIGESWGSALGVLLAHERPDLFYAVIGTGQMVDFEETETYCYNTALQLAKEKRDMEKVEQLSKQAPPPYYGSDVTWKAANYLMYLSSIMSKNPNIKNPGYNTIGDMLGSEYGLYDKVNFARGVVTTFNHVYPQLYGVDLRVDASKLEVPMYMLQGKYDINAPLYLAEEYYNILETPDKKVIMFENSGHSPWINESNLFIKETVSLLLK